ncbi:response regulator [Rhizobium sp. 25PS6]|uniref:response regulator n=1 Tax=Rhizobium sp. 25PS6 TaxID=3075622 RepID=UPI0028FDBAD5|nr:response regulator [Rhizobium sp. 25PS6]MDU0365389.1 response regulator [Rhizobium sp. 25PS6]
MNSETKKLRILVVEDEALVAMMMEDILEELGHEVGAVASRLEDARELARTGDFDLAILDVNLDGQPSYPIAEALKERGIPFAFATGYGNKGLDRSFDGIPTLAKPFVGDDVARLIREMFGIGPSPLL